MIVKSFSLERSSARSEEGIPNYSQPLLWAYKHLETVYTVLWCILCCFIIIVETCNGFKNMNSIWYCSRDWPVQLVTVTLHLDHLYIHNHGEWKLQHKFLGKQKSKPFRDRYNYVMTYHVVQKLLCYVWAKFLMAQKNWALQ